HRRGKSSALRQAAKSGIARRPRRRPASRSGPLRTPRLACPYLLPRHAPAHRHRPRAHPSPLRPASRRARHRPRPSRYHLARQLSPPPRRRHPHRRPQYRRSCPRHPHLWERLTAAMSLLSNTAVLLNKELRTEFRSRELLTTTVVFILVVLILFSFAISPTIEESREFGPGLLWLAILFAASLMLQPCFLREQSNDTLSSLRLAVSDPFSIFLAKLIANTLFLLLTELIMLPFFAIFYNVPILPEFHWLILVLFLGSLGISVAGTALSAISAQARMRELLLPLLLLPLLTPVLVVSATVTVSLFEREPIVKGKGI